MPTARIVTRFPERAASLRKTLLDSGYHVDVVRPEDAQRGAADLEYDIDEMPEYTGQPDTPAEREFIFAPQWRALKARFGKPDTRVPENAAPTPPRVVEKIEPSVSYARLEKGLDEKFVDQPARGPSLLERMQAIRTSLVEKWSSARQEIGQKRQRLAQQMAERRAAAEESRRIREAEAAMKREADRVAAERARAEEALRLQQQKARDAQRLAEVQAQMELRRKEQEQAFIAAQERLRAEAEQRARLEAERVRAESVASETASQHQEPASIAGSTIERRRSLGDILRSASRDLRDWRGTLSSTHFANTRSYALRQYAPAAAGIALAFFLGWAIAVGGARRTDANPHRDVQKASGPAAAVAAAPVTTKKPSAVPQKARAAKQKPQVRRFRRPSQDDEVVWKNRDDGADDEVTVIHHYPGKSSIAHSGKNKNGVKTISDLEQD